LSSSESEEFATQSLGFSAEVNGQRPFARSKSTRDASKNSEYKGEKPKTQVKVIMAEEKQFSQGQLVILLLAIAFSAFMVSVDGFIVNVAIPTISGELGVREDIGTWVVTLFSVSSTLFVLLSGWMAKLFGNRRLFIFSILSFSFLSVLCGLAHNFTLLTILRIFQGAAAGLLLPLSLSMIIGAFPVQKRAIAIGLWSFFVMVGPAMGPMIGGWFSNEHWTWMFYINFPFGIFSAAIVLIFYWGEKEETYDIKIDWVGILLLFVGIGALQIALNRGNVDDWFNSKTIISLMVLCVVCIALFIPWEYYHPQPFLDLNYFKRRNLVLGGMTTGVAMAMLFSSFTLDSLWVQATLGYTPAWAGYTLVPVGLFPLLIYPIMGRIVGWLDPRIWVACSALLYSFTFFWLSRLNIHATFLDIALPRLIQGIGFAMFTVPNSLMATQGIPQERMTFVISLFSFIRLLFVGFGVPLAVNQWYYRESFYQSRITEQTFSGNPPYLMLMESVDKIARSEAQAHAIASNLIGNQASTLGLTDIYYVFGWGFLILIGVVLFYKKFQKT
jgi:DHA2 family multidrug resistance protein